MAEGLAYAERLAKDAHARYVELKEAAESQVVRWRWASFAAHSYKPAHFEISKVKAGRWLKSEPSTPKSGVHGHGFDVEGRVVVVRQLTEFADRYYETFYLHEAGGIASFHYGYGDDKRWINVEWLPGAERVEACHSVYARGNSISTFYDYDDRGRVVRCRRRGTNPPFGDLDDVREIEYDDTGQIVRVFLCTPDGRRHLDFERPAKDATFVARRGDLLRELTEAAVEALRRARLGEEVYAVVLSHCDAEYQHRLPPRLSVGVVSERSRLLAEHADDAPDYLWNPAEWSANELQWPLSPALATLCDSVNQDIWQNERGAEVDELLFELARKLDEEALPFERAEHFACVVVALDMGEIGAQVERQLSRLEVRALRSAGML